MCLWFDCILSHCLRGTRRDSAALQFPFCPCWCPHIAVYPDLTLPPPPCSEQEMYRRAHAASAALFQQYLALGAATINKHLLQIMALLLPMRRVCSGECGGAHTRVQACRHPSACAVCVWHAAAGPAVSCLGHHCLTVRPCPSRHCLTASMRAFAAIAAPLQAAA